MQVEILIKALWFSFQSYKQSLKEMTLNKSRDKVSEKKQREIFLGLFGGRTEPEG